MAIDLNGLVCLITGADQGIGKGVADGFRKRGASVVAGRLNPEAGNAGHVLMDVSKESDVNAAVERVIQLHGRIDVLVNNAGIYPRRRAEEISMADWRSVQDVNLDGAWRCCAAVIPRFKQQRSGAIINVGSIAHHAALGELAHYHASKAGLAGLTRGLARDLGPFGVRVNCLELGAVLTEGETALFPDRQRVDAQVLARQCLPDRMTPESVEAAFAFFASCESSDITGQCIAVDRGWILK